MFVSDRRRRTEMEENMKLYRFPIIIGIFNLFTFIIIEIMLTGFVYERNTFSIFSILGIIIVLLNTLCLTYSIKQNLNKVIIYALLFALIYGIYLTFSFYAITYRFLMIIDGLIITLLSIKQQ